MLKQKESKLLRINKIDCRGSICDGPGIRTVVYLQGCDRRCKQCHNPSTWNMDDGTLYPVYEIFDMIRTNSPTKRVTISGGEPLLQYDVVLELVKLLKDEEYDIALYTGRDFEEVPQDILTYVNYIKYGAYVDELKTTIKYYGSTNQNFICLNGGNI